MYTYKIEQAIKAASLLHQGQLRKGSLGLPYITHLMAVTLILRDYTEDEDTLVAAILHDTVEDTDYTIDELKEDFGGKVAEIVASLSEPREKNGERLSWIERKRVYASQLKNGPMEAVMIAAADKAHNFRSMVEDYYSDHIGFIRDFGINLDERIEAYQNISNSINNKLSDGIVHEFNHTFLEYKKFILNVKANTEKI